MPMARKAEELAPQVAELRRLAREAGRPEPEVVALTGLDVRDPARAGEQVRAYAEAGATRVVHGAGYEDASEFRRAADVLAGIS
jgi:hypothetical protein